MLTRDFKVTRAQSRSPLKCGDIHRIGPLSHSHLLFVIPPLYHKSSHIKKVNFPNAISGADGSQ